MTAETQIIISAKDLASGTFSKVGLAAEGLIKVFERSRELIPFAGAGLGIHSIKEFIEQQVEYIDQSGKMAQITGMNTQTFLEFQYAAMLADLSSESLSKGVGKLSKNMVAAASGSGDAYDAFHTLGVSVKDSSGQLKGADQILEDIADRFAQFEDGPAKTAMAMALFGKSGAEMIPLLNKGAGELRHLREEAEKTGYAFGDEVARQAEEVNDNFKRLHTRTDALKTLVVSGMLPALIDTSEYMLGSATAADKLRENLEYVEKGARGAAYGLVAIKNVLDMVGSAMYYSAKGIFHATRWEFDKFWDDMSDLNKSGWEDLEDINRAHERIWLGHKDGDKGLKGHDGRSTIAKEKPKAPIIPKGDGGEGASTIKSLREEVTKAESGLVQLRDSYDELTLTLAGDAYGADLMKNQREYDKELLDTLKEYMKLDDQRRALAASKKLTGEAAGLIDRAQAALAGKIYGLEFAKGLKDQQALIKDQLTQMAQDAAHQSTMADLTGQGVWEAKAGAIRAKYDALRLDPNTKARTAQWDEEEQAALARNEQDKAKARLQSSAALAELTGRTWDHRNAQAQLLEIEIALAQTAEERQLKEQQLADVLAQRDGNWVDASRKGLQTYEAGARDTWTNVNRLTANAAQSMEDAMVDSAMGTENAWTNALKSIEREIVRVMIRQSAMWQMASLLGGFIGDGVSSLFGGSVLASESYTPDQVTSAVNNLESQILSGARASGGPVGPGTWLVGEKGPELLNLDGPGYVHNAAQTSALMGASSGLGSTQIVIHQSFDFRGADTGTETRLRASAEVIKRQSVAEALAQVQARANRGGSFSKAVGRRQQ